ncbi:dihydrolipoyl dehydrogenase PdhD [Clostridium aceticum]|uniref:Dihydrolipoyl dehydrogenase n=1 Tax=Clostridium aceticum TaxID=84022 RepID=A0A0D8IHG2_9CLOT|nr:dihydrolipoyl dehydrogenase [Clostridium aceticum]AKL94011.1 dihydrolipoyl dehydrogenase PdhD [Clostridium aceticum]KJF28611.1 dihydrolipoamide dehydrogenase [Clostridium aceticum]
MKVVVIGGGPGGYVAAIRAAQLGAEVTLVEKKYIGGTCLNVGCIPTKVLLHTAELYTTLEKESKKLGIQIEKLDIDWKKLQQRKKTVVSQLIGGINMLLKSNKVKVIMGEASFLNENQLEVQLEEGKKAAVDFDYAIIATGSKPLILPIPGADLEGVITSDEALSLEEIPKSMLVIGGGVIGSEFASIYSSMGTKVTIVEALPNIVAAMDQEVTDYLVKALKKARVDIHTDTKVEGIEKTKTGLRVKTVSKEGSKSFEVEKVLLSIGRKPVTENMGLEKIGVKLNKDKIITNKKFQTNINNIYGIGDCRGEIMLAHVASAEGIVAVEGIMGKTSKIDFKTIPYAVYTKPELAAVGMTEKQAKEKGYETKTGKFPLYANGKSLIMGEANGLVKYVVDAKTEEILGLHMAGPRATELIVEGALALRLEATIEEIATTIHAHPTVGESLHEAVHAVHNMAIHLPK